MDLFENKFREQWEQRPEPDFNEEDWRRLDRQLRPRRDRATGLALFLPWLGMAGLALAWWSNRQSVRHLESLAFHSPVSRDTLIIRQEFLTRDTLIITRTIHSRDTVWIMSAGILSHKAIDIPDGKMTADETAEDGMDNPPFSDNNIDPVSSRDAWRNMLGYLATGGYTVGPIPDPVLVTRVMQVDHKPFQSFWQKTNMAIRPTGGYLEGTGEAAIPVGKGIQQASGWTIGTGGGVVYGDNWEFGLNGEFRQLSYELTTLDAGTGIPPVDPPDETYQFQAAEVIRPSAIVGIHTGFVARPGRRFRPWIRIGARLMMDGPREVLYDFRNPNTGVIWTFERNDPATNRLPVIGDLGLGLRARLGRNWWLSVQAGYGRELSTFRTYPDIVRLGGTLGHTF